MVKLIITYQIKLETHVSDLKFDGTYSSSFLLNGSETPLLNGYIPNFQLNMGHLDQH